MINTFKFQILNIIPQLFYGVGVIKLTLEQMERPSRKPAMQIPMVTRADILGFLSVSGYRSRRVVCIVVTVAN